jgi:hypothetical protein
MAFVKVKRLIRSTPDLPFVHYRPLQYKGIVKRQTEKDRSASIAHGGG